MAELRVQTHRCILPKQSKAINKKSLHESPFSGEQVSIIWDFYVTRSFAAQSGLSISLEDYGWKSTTSLINGLPAMEKSLCEVTNMDHFCIIRSKKITDTLASMDLLNDLICVNHSRAVLMQNFTYESNENEEVKIVSKESRINCIFRHIRNAFAHGLTFFFENRYVLLEDKDKDKLTASMLIPQVALLQWISIIDKNEQYYKIVNTESAVKD